MSTAILCFRTITRCGIFRQVSVDGVTTLVPIGIASPPEEVTIDPKDKIEKLMAKACDGRKVVDLTYPDSSDPEVELKFSKATMELESLMHGHVVGSASGSTEVYVFVEFNSGSVPAARATGQIGYSVAAQAEATSKAQLSYVDPVTKLAVPIAIKDTGDTPTGDEALIGAHLAITISPELIAKKVDIVGWVPCNVTNATIVTAEPIGLLTIFLQGINFNNTPRLISIYNASRTESTAIADKPERSIKLSILPSTLSVSGLGWDTVDVGDAQNVC